jgi:hypothetical protein
MYTKDPVYGNHIGIVINNNDPEFRNRVQIFIPHLSMTVYDGWNSKMKDITLGPGWLDSLDVSLQNRLMRSLPWAEAARPIFGGNGTLTNNPQTNQTQIIRQQGGSSNTHLDGNANPVHLPQTASTVSGGSKGLSGGGSGGDVRRTNYGLYAREANGDRNSLAQIGSLGALIPGRSVAVSPELEDYLLEKFPQYKTGESTRMMGARIKIPGDDTIYTISDRTAPGGGKTIDFYSAPVQGMTTKAEGRLNSANIEILPADRAEMKQMATYNDSLYESYGGKVAWWDKVLSEMTTKDKKPTGFSYDAGAKLNLSHFKMNGEPLTDSQLANLLQSSPTYQSLTLKNPYYASALGKTSTDTKTIAEDKKNGTSTPADGNAPIVALDPTVTQASGAYGNVSNPGGVGSKPKRGTMVWVFFLGGDTMKPVYFAGVTEPNSESRTGGGGAPVQLTGEPSTSRNSSTPSLSNDDDSEDNLSNLAKYDDKFQYFLDNKFPPEITNTEAAAQYMLQQAGIIDFKGKSLKDGLKSSSQVEVVDDPGPDVVVPLKPGDMVSDGKIWGIVGWSSNPDTPDTLGVYTWQNGKLQEDASLGKKSDFSEAYRF